MGGKALRNLNRYQDAGAWTMPATDWREITYSRTHLRPGDGLDPDVRAMRRQVHAHAHAHASAHCAHTHRLNPDVRAMRQQVHALACKQTIPA